MARNSRGETPHTMHNCKGDANRARHLEVDATPPLARPSPPALENISRPDCAHGTMPILCHDRTCNSSGAWS
eukprot:12916345-Prorocentrum_lima.AAC.1